MIRHHQVPGQGHCPSQSSNCPAFLGQPAVPPCPPRSRGGSGPCHPSLPSSRCRLLGQVLPGSPHASARALLCGLLVPALSFQQSRVCKYIAASSTDHAPWTCSPAVIPVSISDYPRRSQHTTSHLLTHAAPRAVDYRIPCIPSWLPRHHALHYCLLDNQGFLSVS